VGGGSVTLFAVMAVVFSIHLELCLNKGRRSLDIPICIMPKHDRQICVFRGVETGACFLAQDASGAGIRISFELRVVNGLEHLPAAREMEQAARDRHSAAIARLMGAWIFPAARDLGAPQCGCSYRSP
jgi:hypothetical protein